MIISLGTFMVAILIAFMLGMITAFVMMVNAIMRVRK